MQTLTTKAMTKVAAVATGLAFAASILSLAPVAQAASLTSAQVSSILSMLSAFGADSATIANVNNALTGAPVTPGTGTPATGGACNVGTADLTIGSSGAAVTSLQTALIAGGYAIPAGATGYFGTQTQNAVAAWQKAANIAPAALLPGPISRAAFNLCTPVVVTPPGGTTPPGTTPPSTGLTGSAGSVESYTAISGLSNEEVGESEEVEIAGMEVKADDNSDLELTAVRLDFSTQPGNSDLEDFVTEVNVLLDGKVYATVDAADFNNDNSWTRTVSLDPGAIIRKGDTKDLTVSVKGVNNVDTDDAGDNWALDFISVRYEDAQGASITDTVTYTPVTWNVNTFATAEGVELKVSSGDEDINQAHVINVDATSDTNGVDILSFNLEAKGSDIVIDDFPVNFDTTGTADDPADVINTVYLFADGEEVASETVTGAGDSDDNETITFDNIDFTVKKGDKVAMLVKADFNDVDTTLVEGDTISAQVSATERNAIVADDSSGEQIADADATGTAVGEAHVVYDIGIQATFVSATETMTPGADGTADDDTVTLKLVFDVEAFDGTVYVSDFSTATTAADGAVSAIDVDDGGILYRYEIDGTATVSLMADTVAKSDVTGSVVDTPTNGANAGEFTFEDGEKARITVTVTRSNAAAETLSDGYHDMQLVAIGWSVTAEDDTMNVYEFNLDDFKTDPIFAN